MTAINPPDTAFAGSVAAEPSAVETKPNYKSIYSSTIFAMLLLFLVGVGFPAAMAYGNTAGWALGAFCALWGGPSFGVMAASARVSAWEEKHAAHH